MNQLEQIIKNAYDLHVHIGPEVIPRKYTVNSLRKLETGKLAGCVLKNHFYPTEPMISAVDESELDIYGSIVLNNAVGGMNAEAVYATSLIAKKTFIVWFPTINAEQFLKNNQYEIAPEWVQDKSLKLKSALQTTPVKVAENGALTTDTKKVIKMIAQVGAVLATGHISAEESVLVAEFARKLGVTVIITHPIYQHIQMPIATQKKLAKIGCFMEQPYSMFSMDGISIEEIAAQIKAVGAGSVILSSDVGQEFSPSPSEALRDFAKRLLRAGVALDDIERMLVQNPRKTLSIN